MDQCMVAAKWGRRMDLELARRISARLHSDILLAMASMASDAMPRNHNLPVHLAFAHLQV
jgi:hypothetical protein